MVSWVFPRLSEDFGKLKEPKLQRQVVIENIEKKIRMNLLRTVFIYFPPTQSGTAHHHHFKRIQRVYNYDTAGNSRRQPRNPSAVSESCVAAVDWLCSCVGACVCSSSSSCYFSNYSRSLRRILKQDTRSSDIFPPPRKPSYSNTLLLPGVLFIVYHTRQPPDGLVCPFNLRAATRGTTYINSVWALDQTQSLSIYILVLL